MIYCNDCKFFNSTQWGDQCKAKPRKKTRNHVAEWDVEESPIERNKNNNCSAFERYNHPTDILGKIKETVFGRC